MNKHLKTKEGVDEVSLDIYDIIIKYLGEKGSSIPSDAEDILFGRINNYVDNLAGSPDYRHHN